MNKADLKASWGKYCDTDSLVDAMQRFFIKYHYINSEHGICKMLDKYFTNKHELIELLAKSTHYLGNMRIALDVEMERKCSHWDINNFCITFMGKLHARPHFLKKVDENGKQLDDYLTTGITKLSPKDFSNTKIRKQLTALSDNKNKFNADGYLKSELNKFNYLDSFIYNDMGTLYSPTVSEKVIERAAKLPVPVKLDKGMKTSRAFNKVCVEYGLDKANPTKTIMHENGQDVEKTTYPYNKLFAEYADMVTGGTRKLKFFISVNPLDYLTMSFGVNWTSCHNIKQQGGWCGGCISYMLDTSSIVTYVHSSIPTDFEEGKIYRNMFHFEDDVLIQSRIYPKENDGSTDLYKVFRNFVQNEFTKLLELESGVWVVRKEKCDVNIHSRGVQYTDYFNIPSCNASYPKERSESSHNIVHIGHNRICPNCGREIESNSAPRSLTCFGDNYHTCIPEI